MKEWRIWCDACHKEIKQKLTVTITEDISNFKAEIDLCEDCFQELKKKFIDLGDKK